MYFFIARLAPFEECKDFNPGELRIQDGWILDVYSDLMCIWNADVSNDFDEVRAFCNDMFHLLTLLFVFRSQKLISHQMRNWIESKGVGSRDNVIGAFLSTHAMPNSKSRDNVSWRRVARIFPKVSGDQFLRLALKDYVSSQRDSGDDAFFFAYRSVESVCRCFCSTRTQLSDSDWHAMHGQLGTSKSLIEPLTNAAQDIRHGNTSGGGLKSARANRRVVLGISRDVLTRAFKQRCPGFL